MADQAPKTPSARDAEFYLGGRARALYHGAQPPMSDTSPVGSPMWWRNEGIRDVWNRVPSRVRDARSTPIEVVENDANGNPLPVTFNPNGPPAGQAPPIAGNGASPNPGAVRIPSWANDYWAGYLWALQDPGTAALRLNQAFTPEYKKGLAAGLAKQPPQDPQGLVPTPAMLAQLPSGLVLPGGPGIPAKPPINIRNAPPAGPPIRGGIIVNPPGTPGPAWTPLPVAVTYEIYGREGRRKLPYLEVVKYRNGKYEVLRGDSLLVTDSPSAGFGFAGRPGRWSELTDKSPMNYGLDSDKGVVAWNGRKAYPVPGYELLQLFGPDWRHLIYGY